VTSRTEASRTAASRAASHSGFFSGSLWGGFFKVFVLCLLFLPVPVILRGDFFKATDHAGWERTGSFKVRFYLGIRGDFMPSFYRAHMLGERATGMWKTLSGIFKGKLDPVVFDPDNPSRKKKRRTHVLKTGGFALPRYSRMTLLWLFLSTLVAGFFNRREILDAWKASRYTEGGGGAGSTAAVAHTPSTKLLEGGAYLVVAGLLFYYFRVFKKFFVGEGIEQYLVQFPGWYKPYYLLVHVAIAASLVVYFFKKKTALVLYGLSVSSLVVSRFYFPHPFYYRFTPLFGFLLLLLVSWPNLKQRY
jgi:hypothetical protein